MRRPRRRHPPTSNRRPPRAAASPPGNDRTSVSRTRPAQHLPEKRLRHQPVVDHEARPVHAARRRRPADPVPLGIGRHHRALAASVVSAHRRHPPPDRDTGGYSNGHEIIKFLRNNYRKLLYRFYVVLGIGVFEQANRAHVPCMLPIPTSLNATHQRHRTDKYVPETEPRCVLIVPLTHCIIRRSQGENTIHLR